MTQKFNLETRKALVKAIGEILETKPTYLGMPSAAYQIGALHIAKDGTVTGEFPFGLLTALHERGFEAEGDPAEEPKVAIYARVASDAQDDEPAEAEAPEADPAEEDFPTAPELDQVVIEMPLTGFDPPAIDRLCKMVAAKEELIKLAIGADALPIQVLEDRLAFPWLRTADPDMVDALATFIAALCKTAREKKRVTATPQPTGVNDRYRFRCFMLHIGMIGPEYAAARTKLLKPLQGNSGWLNGPPEKEPGVREQESGETEAEVPADDIPAEEAPAKAPAPEAAAEAPQEETPAVAPAEEAEAHD